jgi:hypothetical protein
MSKERLLIAELVTTVLKLMDRKNNGLLDIADFAIEDKAPPDEVWRKIVVSFSYKGKKNANNVIELSTISGESSPSN